MRLPAENLARTYSPLFVRLKNLLAPGNRVEVMLNGDGTYPRLSEDLRSAQRSITLQLGSMNFDNRSMALNDEATLMVLDRSVGQNSNRIFLDDLRHAEEITIEAFRRRSWLQRIAEWGANSLTRLL